MTASTVRRWALTWSVLHVLGFAAGGWLAGRGTPPGPEAPRNAWSLLSRASLLAPALLAFVPAPGASLVWSGVFLAGTGAGWLEGSARTRRRSAAAPSPWAPARYISHPGRAVLKVTGWSTPVSGGRYRCPARVLRFVPDGATVGGPWPGRGDGLLVTAQRHPGPPGTLLAARVDIRIPAAATLPGGFDYRQFLAGRDLRWTARLDGTVQLESGTWAGLVGETVAPLREGLLDRLDRQYPAAERDLARAVLLGARTGRSREASRPFADLGLAHLFAVSGLHVGILLGIFLLPVRWLSLPPWAPLWLLGLGLPVYMGLTGLPGSVVRASLLAVLAVGARACGRRADSLHSLGLLFWGTTLWWPGQVLDTGVRLSYLAAGGILCVIRSASDWRVPGGRGGRAVAGALAVSLAAIWFTFPQAAQSFGRLPLLAPAANLVAVPLFGLGVWGVVAGLMTAGFPDIVPDALTALTWLLLRGLSGVTALAAGRLGGLEVGLAPPGPLVLLAWLLATGGLLVLLRGRIPRRELGVVLAGLLAVVVLSVREGSRLVGDSRHLTVTLFDVGQGDASLVRFPDGWTALIDTGGVFGFGPGQTDGPLARSVLPFLTRAGVKRLDAVVLTHGHADHTGGNPALVRNITVDRWFCGGRARAPVPHCPAEAGEVLHRDGAFALQVVFAPSDTLDHLHENDRSLVTALRWRDRGLILFPGDLETRGEQNLLRRVPFPGTYQVLKAGHHGSSTSGSAPFLSRITPGLVLISCGVENRYDHPSHGAYVARGDTLPQLRTDLDGTVVLQWDRQGRGRWTTRRAKGRLAAVP